MIPEQAIFVALGFSIIGQLSYIRDTLAGRNQPNRVTWFIWGLIPMLAFAGQIGEGIGIQSLHTFIVGLGPLAILAATFVNRKAYWKLSRFDIGCGILSVMGIILWLVTQDGVFAVAFAIAADALAGLPTLKKTWTHPHSESWMLFALGIASSVITLLTFDRLTFVGAGFAAYILLSCTALVVVGLLRSRRVAAPRL